MSKFLGQNLVFLISQPRAGSTLLQSLLGQHCKIHTQSEPWLMLYPSFFYKKRRSVYDYNLEQIGITSFMDSIPEGHEILLNGIRKTYASLYEASLNKAQKTIFLDKTPRYYHIVEELKYIFPKAKFIFLIRNPMAVLFSLLERKNLCEYHRLSENLHDLILAPRVIAKESMHKRNTDFFIHYEKLVASPQEEISKLLAFLNVEDDERCYNLNNNPASSYKMGDQNILNTTKVMNSYSENWESGLLHPQTVRLFKDYLEELGDDIFSSLGYDFQVNSQKIQNIVDTIGISKTLDLSYFIDNKGSIHLDQYIAKSSLQKEVIALKHQNQALSKDLKALEERLRRKTYLQRGIRKLFIFLKIKKETHAKNIE